MLLVERLHAAPQASRAAVKTSVKSLLFCFMVYDSCCAVTWRGKGIAASYIYIYTYTYGCVFFSGVQILVRVGSSSSANHTHESYPEPYPESYLRIIPPKITIMNVSFGIVWDCMASLVLMDVTSQLTSVGQIR